MFLRLDINTSLFYYQLRSETGQTMEHNLDLLCSRTQKETLEKSHLFSLKTPEMQKYFGVTFVHPERAVWITSLPSILISRLPPQRNKFTLTRTTRASFYLYKLLRV